MKKKLCKNKNFIVIDVCTFQSRISLRYFKDLLVSIFFYISRVYFLKYLGRIICNYLPEMYKFFNITVSTVVYI